MRRVVLWPFAVAAACAFLPGCAVGYNSLLFVTKSNVGVDIDSKPPTAEISIARREGAIAPVFEGGATPPLLASFQYDIKGIIGLFSNVSSAFAGGDAAVTMSKLYGDGDAPNYQDSVLCLSTEPSPKLFGMDVHMPKPGEVKPFLFGTDTTLGLKLAWSGLTAQVPDTVKLGYSRKEFAYAPLFGQAETCTRGTTAGRFTVKAPSFMATVDGQVKATSPSESGLDHLQYFATGAAASELARRQEVRRVMLRRIAGTQVVSNYGPDDQSACLEHWLSPDSDGKRRAALKAWMGTNKVPGDPTDLVYGKEYRENRQRAIKDLGVSCQ